jgi:predicted oxidoreductase
VSEVIVIGGGIAGICAALELLDAGRRVLLLERDTEENFGGLAKESFGGIFLVGTPEQRRAGIRDTPELALADWHAFGELDLADRWPCAWAEAYVQRCHDEVGVWLRRAASASCPRRTGSSAASTRPATRCRAFTSSGAPGGNWRCA